MMEEQTTWKGHTFTLIVFTGIVVLSSIFFILGMLVGRAQGQKYGSTATASAKSDANKAVQKEDKPDFTFYDSVKKEDPPALQPPPPAAKSEERSASAPAALEPAKKLDPVAEKEPAPEPASGSATASVSAIYFQVGAVRKSPDAQKLLDELKKKGFHAFILAPPDGDPNPYYRVQVGPFTDAIEAEEVENKLKSAKYQVLRKK